MTPVEDVVLQMLEWNLPSLPAGHPKVDGKIHRFGKGKKAWYVLREVTLRSGKVVITGHFGNYQGENPNTVKVKIDSGGWGDTDKAEFIRKQREQEERDQAKREEEARFAANRAKGQWTAASPQGAELHPYLVKKAVTNFGLRVNEDGQLFIPLWSDGGTGDRLVGLQKIFATGAKLYNEGIDKNGAGFVLGEIPADPKIIAVGEGYATCATAHMGSGQPVVAAFDAGSIIHVARALRAKYKTAHLLFLADDDYLLEQRLADTLRKEFSAPFVADFHLVGCGYVPVIDGNSHQFVATDGETVDLTAWWRTDKQGIAYIEADIRKGRSNRHTTFKNAGVWCSHAAAAEVGNATVIKPIFASRCGQKWTDFNDLHVEESFDAAASQINHAFDVALGVAVSPAPSRDSETEPDLAPPVPSSEADLIGVPALISPAPLDADGAPPSDPAPPLGMEERLSSAAEPREKEEKQISAAELRGEEDMTGAAGAPQEKEPAAELPAVDDAVEAVGFLGLQWAVDHCALVYGTTDVWDSLNGLRVKKSAFIGMIGKENYKAWEKHESRRLIMLSAPAQDDAGEPAPSESGGGDNGKKKIKVYDDEHWQKVNRLLDNFALIYGSDEVWDGEQRCLLKINPLRLAFGNDAIKYWLGNASRKMVPVDRVVFDPTMKADPATTVNLFNGFAMAPKAGEFNLILELLFHLCGSDEAVFEWVVCWLAYPLQHPGAKMDTAVVMHGDEGSGKNLLFEKCVARIYGEYGGIIGNAELEDKFNDWASKKLFVVCDEVVTRNELRQLKGKLKGMVSNATIRINPKGLASRDEANHMNFMFFSNELQPLALDKTDRRNMVIWTPPKQAEEYYAAVAHQIFNGGTEAFYKFLLDVDVGSFNEHTKPIMTEAKANLISLGLSPTERFYREWSGGFLPLPYVCCSAMQLYQAFCRWSTLNGERFPATQTMFGRTIGRVSFGEMTSCPIKYDLMSEVRQRTVYLVGDQPEGRDRHKWVEDGSTLFETALRKYRHVFTPDDS
ncbi:DUF5906 domain-containing protein [Undibacterium sp. Di27W]|uniref:DUF5906 domain-containing protein n=1 Tax=Undibacterium sp. Di27W TaxID=3413036 RepID=UPI003BF07BD4